MVKTLLNSGLLLGMSLSGIYVLLMLYAFVTAERQIFPQLESSYEQRDDLLRLPYTNARGEKTFLVGKWMKAPESNHVILYHHGNGEDIGHLEERLKQFQAMGFDMFVYDYPGYGLSPGESNEANTLLASEIAYQYLKEELNYTPESILHYGHSLGGGPALHLANQFPSGGVILEGTFLSTFRIVTKIRILPWDIFNNKPLVSKVDAPLLVIHGTEDETVPFSHGESLYELATTDKDKLWVEGGGHTNLHSDFEPLWKETLLDFYRSKILNRK